MLRALNNLVAFAGLSMNLSNFSTTCGQLPLVVQGSVDVGLCHLNPHSETASFAQLYICDDYNRRRSIKETMLQWKTKIEYRVIEKVIATLREINVIAQSYHSMYEVYLAEAAAAKLNDDDVPPTILMNLKHSREAPQSSLSSTHEGRLNIPQIENQVAAIYICRNGVLPSEDELNKGLRIFSRGGKSTAAHFNNNIDAMSYPLYFPRGEQSYVRESLRKRTGKRPASDISNEANVRGLAASSFPSDDDSEDELMDRPPAKFLSRGDFYRFLLSRRGNLLEHRFYGTGKLLSQYVIHAFSRIEADQLNAIARNTVELRSCKATALYSYLDQQLQEKGFKLGKLVNLPQNFIGSTQWYDNLYHNAMAVAQRVGKPDLFITFTGNQDWPEIRENLVTKFDSWITDPLLCVRVFRLRLQSLIKEIIDKKMFGEVVALQYSVEFQKRGMPHAHILVTLKEKLNTPDKIDAWISAELPQYPSRDDSDAAEKLQLFQLVTRFMVHRPCKTRPDFACRVKDPAFCDKHFPKPFREYTELTDDGYPLYRRRDNGRTAPVGRTKMNYVSNADVIPYNAYLLRKYMCHVNVECCCSITAFKYIYKYIYKGPDRILFELLRNEALLQQRARPGTNGDRCVDIDMRDYAMHTVISLSAHLPGQQPVYLKGALTREVRPTSKLLAYFSVVNTNEQARRMTWIEVAEQFRWTGKEYVELQRSGRRIARLWPVRPKMRELYALRKLLFHVRGASSYEYLRTVNGITYDTFMEAAEAAGYIESETEWEECLKSAAVLELPHAIRGLYAQILLYCHPTNPLRLWHNYKIAMRTRQRNTHVDKPDDVLDMLSLNHIESILTSNGSSLEDCGLKDVRDALLRDCGSYLASGRVSPDVDMPAENTAHPLTGEQERIVNAIVTAAALPKGVGNKLYYIDGKAGCGKTHTLNALIVHLKAVGKQVLATASTGIAATLLKGGRTAHSLFCLPIKQLHSSSIANVEPSSPTGQMLHSVDVIVWDEISMQSRFALECVDRLLRDVAVPSLTHVPFGGVTMVLGGDWCQFLPVIHGGTRQETIDAACRSSPLWEKFITFTLHQNLRLCNNEMGYARWLLSVGIGGNSQEDGDLLIPRCMCDRITTKFEYNPHSDQFICHKTKRAVEKDMIDSTNTTKQNLQNAAVNCAVLPQIAIVLTHGVYCVSYAYFHAN
ncbi:unnamed protein product [Cylicostephanus goldi]|uniref:ATP-dependent DNA helicase n=1 Tax=Cylicostephanus goldi TaxID=71465 RepID=A0A3P7PH43_CYLGO|nr:unnamed protein product [Cylicostephanus goldi]